MAKGYPSMTALLGLLAVAGYQNRDKIASMLSELTQGGKAQSGQVQSGQVQTGQASGQGGLGGLLSGLGGILGGGANAGGAGDVVSGGLQELVERFTRNGQGDAARSWVQAGPNQEIAPTELEQAIGPDVLQSLSQKTGLPRQEILDRLARTLPNAVNDLTPEGRVPTPGEAHRFST